MIGMCLVVPLSLISYMSAHFAHCLFRWASATVIPRSSCVCVCTYQLLQSKQRGLMWLSSFPQCPLRLYCWETFSHLSIWTSSFRNVNHSRDSHFSARAGGWPSLGDLVESQWWLISAQGLWEDHTAVWSAMLSEARWKAESQTCSLWELFVCTIIEYRLW